MFKSHAPVQVLVGIAFVFAWAAPAFGQANDVADVPAQDLRAGGDQKMRYFLIGPAKGAKAPGKGFGLVLVLPGGDGGAGFHPFVKRIFKYALVKDYLVAQLVAAKWTPKQQIVWPTRINTVPQQKFSTEEFIQAVAADVEKRHKIDKKRVFSLGWSSGGPAAYAASLRETKTVAGSFIAMSVFKPKRLPPLKHAAGHAYFLYHSLDDKVCPFWMAKQAREQLVRQGAAVVLLTDTGGHGWRGKEVFANIRQGIRWLEISPRPAAVTQPSRSLLLHEGFETGMRTPPGWVQGTRVQGVRFALDREVAFAGRASLRVEKTVRKSWPIAQWFRTIARPASAKQLNVTAQVKAKAAAKAVVDVQFIGAGGKTLGHEWAVYVGAKKLGDPRAEHDWREYSGTVSIPADARLIRIALQMYGPGTVWFDDLRVSRPGGKAEPKAPDRTPEKKARSELNLARAYLGANRKLKAKEILERVVAKYPDSEAAKEARRLLQGLK